MSTDLVVDLVMASVTTMCLVLLAVLAVVFYRRELATAEAATGRGRHHHGRARSLRRRCGSRLLTVRRAAARLRRRLEATTWPVPVTADPLVHGPAGMAS